MIHDIATPRRAGRPRSEASHAAVLAAAGELMLEGGLAAATIEAIAARAGVGKATIYKWWRSRAAVALEGFMASVADSWALPENVPVAEALIASVGSTIRHFIQTPAGPLLRALAAEAQSQPEIGQALREQWFAPRRAVTAEVIRRGIAAGELRADVDLATVSDLLFGPVYYRLLFAHEPLDQAFAAQIVAHVLPGIAARPARPSRSGR